MLNLTEAPVRERLRLAAMASHPQARSSQLLVHVLSKSGSGAENDKKHDSGGYPRHEQQECRFGAFRTEVRLLGFSVLFVVCGRSELKEGIGDFKGTAQIQCNEADG